MKKNLNIKGFTLIELIIVIAVIALLAAATFVAVDPAKRIGQARDAQRWADVTAIADAITQYVADNNGTFPTSTVTSGVTYGIMPLGVPTLINSTCQNTSTSAILGILLTNIAPTYIPTMPLDPAGASTYTTSTGYYLYKDSSGRVTIGACKESDYATASIKVQR